MKRSKEDNLIMSRIDDLLTQWNISQKELCEKINISSAALSSLRKSNGVPSAETTIAICEFFKVDPIWLVKGKLNFSGTYDNRPSEIYNRIQDLIRKKFSFDDKYDQFYNITTISNFHTPLSDATSVSLLDIVNWHYDRAFPKTEDLCKIADFFKKSLYYIAFGFESTVEKPKQTKDMHPVPNNEYDDYCRFKEYKYFMYSYDCLYAPDKKYISTIVQRLFRLRRKIEGHDWDFDYNQKHPTEKPREKDPNISDEEYEEKKKRES